VGGVAVTRGRGGGLIEGDCGETPASDLYEGGKGYGPRGYGRAPPFAHTPALLSQC